MNEWDPVKVEWWTHPSFLRIVLLFKLTVACPGKLSVSLATLMLGHPRKCKLTSHAFCFFLGQGSANYGPWAKASAQLVFVNKGQRSAGIQQYAFTYVLSGVALPLQWLVAMDCVACKVKNFTTVFFTENISVFSCPVFYFIYYFNELLLFLAALSLVAPCMLSLVAVSGVYSLLQYMGFSFRWLLFLWSTGPRGTGSRSRSPLAQQRQLLGLERSLWSWCTGLAAPRHVESSQIMDQALGPSHWHVGSNPLYHQGDPILYVNLSILHS